MMNKHYELRDMSTEDRIYENDKVQFDIKMRKTKRLIMIALIYILIVIVVTSLICVVYNRSGNNDSNDTDKSMSAVKSTSGR